ncbi:MAG: hypothetical protein D8M59_09830 [Planctomycetes bacterium]|nr:hypothetical protein [Planctomycetota bacterium]NOG53443.1 hypothetical protein [Planctomycetota bacterium]
MYTRCLLPATALILSQGALAAGPSAEQDIRRFAEVDAGGARVVTEYQDAASGRTIQLSDDTGCMPEVVTSPNWVEADGGLAWICRDIAVGDNGAMVLAGKGLNNESLTMYNATSATPVWDFDALDSEDPIVSMAQRANRAAGMVIYDMDPGPDYDFEATVHVFSNTGDGTPEWSYTFPRTLNYFGGGTAVSDDGDVVLMWKADPNSQYLLVEAFRGDGTPISSGQVQTVYNGNVYFHARQTVLSDDGRRAYFNVGVEAVIYDVQTASVIYSHSINASFDSHALSGDGKTFAFGYFGYFEAWRETTPGNWNRVARQTQAGSTYVARLDLNDDGSRLGYQIQQYSPAYDHIEIGMYDVDNDVDMFHSSYDAPGTAYQLACAGVRVDQNGDSVAGISWGDSSHATPEGFVYDAAGNVTCEISARGSAFGIGFDADGDVLAMGTKAVHANEFGNGGDVMVADAYDKTLRIVGYPVRGGTINLEVPAVGQQVRIVVCSGLGVSNTPYGPTEVDLGTELRRLGPYAIPGQGLVLPIDIPNSNSLAGRALHFQALITGPGGELTNKVSIRVQP